jgi:hypothetical protein
MDPLFYSAAIIITIIVLFFGARFIRNVLSNLLPQKSTLQKPVGQINEYKLGGLATLGWIVWSIATLWGTLQNWQIGLALAVFGGCVFIYRRFKKKDEVAEQLQTEKDNLQSRLNHLSTSYDILSKEISENLEVIETPEKHREIILQALKEAHSKIIILSGWLTDWAFNEEFRTLLLAALQRGVLVYIGYGYQSKNDKKPKRKEQKKAAEDLSDLQAWCAEKNPSGRLQKWEYPNHAKLLLVDDSYAICGSFNWLSNSGGHNTEMSFKVKNRGEVDQLATKIIYAFDSRPPDRRGLLKMFVPFSDH